MLRLSYVTPEEGERSVAFDGLVVRFGADAQCDVRLRGESSAQVQGLHGEFINMGGSYALVGHNAACRLWVDGKAVQRTNLRGGERIRVGSLNGPEIQVVSVGKAAPGWRQPRPEAKPEPRAEARPEPNAEPKTKPEGERETKSQPQPPSRKESTSRPVAQPRPPAQPPSQAGAPRGQPAEVQQWLSAAEKQIQRARSEHEGHSSGKTMFILAEALTGLRQSAEGRASKTRMTLILIGSTSLAAVVCLGWVIWAQQQRINQLVREKAEIDAQIRALSEAMERETDEARLEQMEGSLQTLVGSAKEKVAQVSRSSPRRGTELAESADPFERDLHKLLKSFNAETYVIPPNFKQRIAAYVGLLVESPSMRIDLARKRRYWSTIQGALQRSELPKELGYIAYTESRFDPTARNEKSGAAGMWQLAAPTARTCGITVAAGRDDRLDPERSSAAATCYLSRLLVEFGEESFMLVLASYNRGENGVRNALHRVAKEPGGYKKRDFWHLYRLKLLPEETREYVPQVLAAALVFENPERYGLKAE